MKKLIIPAIVAVATLGASAASATQAWVGQAHLNARSGPGTNYSVLGTFNPCTPVDVIEYQYDWAKVYYDNTYYWVSAKYLQDYACTYSPPTYTPPAYTPPKQTYKAPVYTPPKKQYGGSGNY
ncbi:SH3 domain-containing protein [Maliponia aquimaris]|uniref:Bacterial SH3 domain protein n=1 Tax=Maliponia aquimaris TaxID=1673631 RepID=A0A238KQ17_9RHOB|nr:SH3 domain-containing protein [Maliponia aquimaris]SMX44949.1 Bacterial SH3 domain protein [Maliponia aquimaris]